MSRACTHDWLEVTTTEDAATGARAFACIECELVTVIRDGPATMTIDGVGRVLDDGEPAAEVAD